MGISAFMCLISNVDHTMSLIMFLSLASHNLTPFSLSPSNTKHLMRTLVFWISTFFWWFQLLLNGRTTLVNSRSTFPSSPLFSIPARYELLWLLIAEFSLDSRVYYLWLFWHNRLVKSCELYVTVSICKTPNSMPVSVAI